MYEDPLHGSLITLALHQTASKMMEFLPLSLPPSKFLSFLFHVLAILLLSMNVPTSGFAATFSNKTDLRALLHFKNQIDDDPLHTLSSWNNTTLHFCEWEGVRCSRGRHQRVTALNLLDRKLEGTISPYIGNLTFLRNIELADNFFHGTIPKEIDRLFHLRFLSLDNNTLSGEVPANLTHCPELRYIYLSGNQLVGNIPTELGFLPKLVHLKLNYNNLTGSIPPSLGNLTSLIYLFLNRNSLQGSIPHDLARLVRLRKLALGENRLTGSIPPKLYNVSSIILFDVDSNNLHGHLPSNLGISLHNLEELYVGLNQFTGSIPISLANASGLTIVDLSINSFSGSVPVNLGSLKGLFWVGLGLNQLGNGDAHDLSFIDSLINCTSLQYLDISYNRLSSALPTSIANLSTQLQHLWLGDNMIFGSIPSGIQNLVGLTSLNLGQNRLTVVIPIGIGRLNKVEALSLGTNELSGNIPSSLGNITRLYFLDLSINRLQGGIPSSLGNCKDFQFLYLYNNNFGGTLPKQLLSNPSLIELEVQNNFFTGNLPVEVGHLTNLEVLRISNNKLSGEIPSLLGNCLGLEYVLLDGNFFQGPIPLTFSTLRGLQVLDLSRNNFSGEIPKFLEELLYLQNLNLSFNNFEGELPKHGVFKNASKVSVLGNNKLCGGIQELQLPACPRQAYNKPRRPLASKVKIIIIIVTVCLIMLSCFFAIVYWVRRSRQKLSSQPALEDSSTDVSFAELFKATDEFASANLIGTGSFGSVYKGILDRDIGTIVAVKVLNLQQQGALKGFMAECEALRSIRHRNLVKILTCCSSVDFSGNDFKALVFKYMPNGSLDQWLHGDGLAQLSRNLNFIQRLNIAIDVGFALDYLHHYCYKPIIHRDLKPSNILLDDDMVAHVGDFGLARFIAEAQTSSVGMKGSIGYIAPEYAIGGKASAYGDVYSYGILLLEMITGKRPTDDMFKDNLSLHHFVSLALPERAMEIADLRLLEEEKVIQGGGNHVNTGNKMRDCLVSMARIGVLCSRESPRDRMDMGDVVAEMRAIQDLYLGVGIHQDRQMRLGMPSEGPSYISHY